MTGRLLVLLDVVRRGVERVEAGLVSGSILGIVAASAANVFTRTLLGFSLAWAEELSQFLMITVTFVGLSYAARQGRHVRMTAITDQLPARAREGVRIGITASTSALLLALALFAADYVATVRTLGTVSPALQVPLWLVYAVAPVGLGFGAVQYAVALVDEPNPMDAP